MAIGGTGLGVGAPCPAGSPLCSMSNPIVGPTWEDGRFGISPITQQVMAGAVAQYDLTNLVGGTTSVPNLISGGLALTLVGTPTLGTGVFFSGATQYAVTASSFTGFSMVGEWTMVIAGIFSSTGTNAGISEISTTANSNNFVEVIGKGISGTCAYLYLQAYDGTTIPSSQGTCGSPTRPNDLFVVSQGNQMKAVNAENNWGSYLHTITLPGTTGTPVWSIGADVRSTVSHQTDSLTVYYAILFNRALPMSDMQQVHAWLQRYLGTKGVFLENFYQTPNIVNLPNNGLFKTPPMGWNSYRTMVDAPTDTGLRAQADAMVSTGMAAAGYQYIGVDNGWMQKVRDTSGNLQAVTSTFPSGISATINYVHSKGLKFGMYGGPGILTCGSYGAGSYRHELQDAIQYAAWGVDYLKYDQCEGAVSTASPTGSYGFLGVETASTTTALKYVYQLMGMALRLSGRNIAYNTSAGAGFAIQTWGTNAGGNQWRYGNDSLGTWASLLAAYDADQGLEIYAGPGKGWNDPDYVNVGNGTLTDTEGQSQMSLWSLLAAPLVAAADLTTLSGTSIATLTNAEVIAVDQDVLGVQGKRVTQVVCGGANCDVIVKQLSNGAWAIGFLNRDSAPHDIVTTWSAIQGVIAAFPTSGFTTTRDLWAHAALAAMPTGYTATAVPAHGVTMIRVAP
jgi:alpha-galactosidase